MQARSGSSLVLDLRRAGAQREDQDEDRGHGRAREGRAQCPRFSASDSPGVRRELHLDDACPGSAPRRSRLRSPFLILSTTSMPDTTSPNERVLAGERSAALEADEELRIGRIRALRARHADGAALVGRGRELGRKVRQVGLARAGAGRVAGLGHEAVDDPVEGDTVVEAALGERLDLLRRASAQGRAAGGS